MERVKAKDSFSEKEGKMEREREARLIEQDFTLDINFEAGQSNWKRKYYCVVIYSIVHN